MTNQDDKTVAPAEQSAQPTDKKPYQTPELTAHGRVDEITQVLLNISNH